MKNAQASQAACAQDVDLTDFLSGFFLVVSFFPPVPRVIFICGERYEVWGSGSEAGVLSSRMCHKFVCCISERWSWIGQTEDCVFFCPCASEGKREKMV